MNVVKILLYLATGILVLGLLFVFALPIVIIGIIFLLLEAVFGVKLIDRRFVGRFHRCSRPRPAQPPEQEAEPDVPARRRTTEVPETQTLRQPALIRDPATTNL